MYRWRHFLAESAARALPFPKSQRPTCPFSFAPGGSSPARPSAASVAARCEPFSANRLTPASCGRLLAGTMAAGAREQAASCDAFVLSRRLPAPDAPPIRTSPAGLIAKAPSNSPRTMGRSLGQNCRWPALSPLAPAAPRPWNIRRCVEHRGAHQGRFHSPR